jgi:glyoxylase-like metal-dependent hydrolase (beta-lactamase superfamily II)
MKNGIGKWKLTTIDCGWHIANKINLTPGWDNMSIKLPYLAFLLQNGEKNILVDNGINERFLIDGKAWGGAPADCGEKDLVGSLAKAGLKPSDIDAVIYTHLHNDHAGNSQLFTKTVSYAQKDDLDNLLNPCFAETPRRDFDFDVIPTVHRGPHELSDPLVLQSVGRDWVSQAEELPGPSTARPPTAGTEAPRGSVAASGRY